MTKRLRPTDVLPMSLPPRGLSRAIAAAYIGVSATLFDQMVSDGRMPLPKRVNSRKIWDRHEIDRHFDALEPGGDGGQWDVQAFAVRDYEPAACANTCPKLHVEMPRTAEEWAEKTRQWRENVVASRLQSRELIGLAGLYEVKSERVKRIKGAGVGTMERLEARGYVQADGEPPPGKCTSYRITEEGKKHWEALPESTRNAVTFSTLPPFPA